jgi:hypothetical protein
MQEPDPTGSKLQISTQAIEINDNPSFYRGSGIRGYDAKVPKIGHVPDSPPKYWQTFYTNCKLLYMEKSSVSGMQELGGGINGH